MNNAPRGTRPRLMATQAREPVPYSITAEPVLIPTGGASAVYVRANVAVRIGGLTVASGVDQKLTRDALSHEGGFWVQAMNPSRPGVIQVRTSRER